MIQINSREITQVIKNNLSFAAIFKGLQLVWQAISSCFGKGYWRNDKPWLNNEGWANDSNGIVTPTVQTCATPVIHIESEYSIIIIICSTYDAEIHYTLDGTDPTSGSPRYSGVIHYSDSGTVKAIALKSGFIDSPIVSADF